MQWEPLAKYFILRSEIWIKWRQKIYTGFEVTKLYLVLLQYIRKSGV